MVFFIHYLLEQQLKKEVNNKTKGARAAHNSMFHERTSVRRRVHEQDRRWSSSRRTEQKKNVYIGSNLIIAIINDRWSDYQFGSITCNATQMETKWINGKRKGKIYSSGSAWPVADFGEFHKIDERAPCSIIITKWNVIEARPICSHCPASPLMCISKRKSIVCK